MPPATGCRFPIDTFRLVREKISMRCIPPIDTTGPACPRPTHAMPGMDMGVVCFESCTGIRVTWLALDGLALFRFGLVGVGWNRFGSHRMHLQQAWEPTKRVHQETAGGGAALQVTRVCSARARARVRYSSKPRRVSFTRVFPTVPAREQIHGTNHMHLLLQKGVLLQRDRLKAL